MTENLFCDGQKFVTDQYKDGWYRSFMGYPDMNEGVKKLLQGYAKKGKYTSILIFFADKCGYDTEYASFLMREVARGFI